MYLFINAETTEVGKQSWTKKFTVNAIEYFLEKGNIIRYLGSKQILHGLVQVCLKLN